MSLVDDLKAVRALIDTSEKLDEVGSVRAACGLACCDADTRIGRLRASEAFAAILDQHGDLNAVPAPPGYGSYVTVSFVEGILHRIDRAIQAAEPLSASHGEGQGR